MANPRKEFSKIYDKCIDKIYRFIFLKVNSQEIAQDLSSETFLRGWEAYKSNPKIDNPSAFLYRIARNLVTDYYRQKARTQFVSPEAVPIIDPNPGIEEKAVLNSDLNTIREALPNLSEEYQDVIIWHYLDDLSIKEVAEMMGRTEGAARVLLHRALKKLRNVIKET